MKGQDTLFSHKSDEWETPRELLDSLNARGYILGLDLAATNENKISPEFVDNFTKEISDRLDKRLIKLNQMDDRVIPISFRSSYCNPPYSNIKHFVSIISEAKYPCIMLLPARTDTKWFHDYIYNNPEAIIEFIKGRLKFSKSKNSAPFPSMLVFFRCKYYRWECLLSQHQRKLPNELRRVVAENIWDLYEN